MIFRRHQGAIREASARVAAIRKSSHPARRSLVEKHRKCKTKTTHISRVEGTIIYAPAPFRLQPPLGGFVVFMFDVPPSNSVNMIHVEHISQITNPSTNSGLSANVVFLHYMLYFLIFCGFATLFTSIPKLSQLIFWHLEKFSGLFI